ncbi:hypothetical protein KGA66_06080 [Actinocrinis puniceicyclus]|uniref:Uncharacterized protein n=1 Tax=Actinocrinis puniceicyclus TaxID=977794 RepID=A0A8J7WM11_9ACTN|nr:hypothetical protein [Actinocrinis puniceicyclus]MBS2962607.1 hypothetical protein [Actinocrinis puniceicyclus]
MAEPAATTSRRAADHLRAFLDAWNERHTTRDQVLVQTEPGSADMLTSDDLRALLAAADPDEQPIAHVPTKAGLDYLALRKQQHPKEATDA